MCVISLTEVDAETARAIWNCERLLQQRDKHQQRLADLSRMKSYVDTALSPSYPAERGGEAPPLDTSAPAGAGDHMEFKA